MKNNKKGFTLIELLVVIAIIGLLATLSVVALNNARQKSRDAKRVSDIKQIQTALELYRIDSNQYPEGTLTLGSTASAILCDTGDVEVGFADVSGDCTGTTYMGSVPSNPTPGGADYSYTSSDGASYTLTFTLEGATGGLASGPHTATADGIN